MEMIRTVIASLLAGVLVSASASACGFHNYTPQSTLVERLLGSDDIVLARSSPENPFRYEATEALEGLLEYVEIPQLVDSTTRRKLALNPNARVLFARDGAYGPWQRLAFVDNAFEPVLRHIMARLGDWEMGEDSDRFSYFASILDHPDPFIHRMALRELDAADYGTLRGLSIDVGPARLMQRIYDPKELELLPIRILLLGMNDEDGVENWLEEGVSKSVLSDGRFLGAYATALIEMSGADAIRSLAGKYLMDRSLTLYTRELLIESLALHGQRGDPLIGAAVSEAIESALWIEPGLAGPVARQFGAKGVWSQKAALSMTLSKDGVASAEDREDVVQYLALAVEEQQDR